MIDHLHPVILAGGSGTRFWPLSREKRPKQFLPLSGGEPLIVETWLRVAPIATADHAWVVCGRAHEAAVRAALPQLPAGHVLVEPAAKNTAPAIGLAAVHALHVDPEAMLAILPSDHHIARPDAFREALAHGARAAAGGALVTIAIKPTRPDTGFGYLRRGAAGAAGTFAVEAFVEKPDAATAARYVQDPAYSWNAGIFLFRADAILAALARHLPAAHERLQQIALALPSASDATARAFAGMPSISIDYAVMEPESKAGRIVQVAGDFGWSDVGSFAALPEVRALDASGNALAGDALAVDCRDCVVLAEGGRLVAAVGLEGLCVVDAGDAILVVPKDKSQDVRKVVEALRAGGRTDRL